MEDLERHLRSLCADDARLRLLEAQWEYDKRLVQQALQTVGTTFPHYSLHDASHSNTILVNVTRVLGNRVKNLSATDTWLILEAAYWHDVGMVVNDSTLRSWWSSADFREHFTGLKDGPDPLLAAAARLLEDRLGLRDLGEDWPIDVRQALTFVVADFARSRHPMRSADAIRYPSGFRIESPRTLIPQRLFEWLAKICLAHGQSREEVAELPLRENGIGRDLCHPRFIAFMLRLGDLLDLDNGRFCPVLLASIGRIPPTSVDHIGKHASITRFYVAPERIDVEAMCAGDGLHGSETEGSVHGAYRAVSQWLEWLRAELTYLAVRWADIAPAALGGGSPSIGTLRAQLRGYVLAPNCPTSEFAIDSDYFLALSKSSGLFGSPQQAWQRELITNAVDATLIRLWHTMSDAQRSQLTKADDPLKEVCELSKQYPIDITISPSLEAFGDPPMRRWDICISDHGCGIGLDDVRSLQVVGSASGNRRRQRLIAQMPPELQPTGSFGLGFQSIFLDTDEVTIETCDMMKHQAHRIVVARPSPATSASLRNERNLRTGIYIQEMSPDPRTEPRTRISFSVVRHAAFGSTTQTDPVLTDSSCPTTKKWEAEIRAVCGWLPVHVFVNGCRVISDRMASGFTHFVRAQSMRISFGDDFIGENNESMVSVVRAYRGSSVTHAAVNSALIGYTADLYAGKASKMLQVNRTGFTTDGTAEFNRRLGEALPEAVDAYVAHLRREPLSDPGALQRASFFSHVEYKSSSAGEEWRELQLIQRIEEKGIPSPVPIRELLAQDNVEILVTTNSNAHILWPPIAPRSRQLPLGRSYLVPTRGYDLFLKFVGQKFGHICWVDVIGPVGMAPLLSTVLVFSVSRAKSDGERVSKEAFEFSVLPRLAGRVSWPCPNDFGGLRLADRSLYDWASWASIGSMLSPFTFEGKTFGGAFKVKVEHVEKYVEYVAKNRAVGPANEPAGLSEVARLVLKLIQRVDEVYQRYAWIQRMYDLAALKGVLEGIARG